MLREKIQTLLLVGPRPAPVEAEPVSEQPETGPEWHHQGFYGCDRLLFFRPCGAPNSETVHSLGVVFDHAVEVGVQHEHGGGAHVCDLKLLRGLKRVFVHVDRWLVVPREKVAVDGVDVREVRVALREHVELLGHRHGVIIAGAVGRVHLRKCFAFSMRATTAGRCGPSFAPRSIALPATSKTRWPHSRTAAQFLFSSGFSASTAKASISVTPCLTWLGERSWLCCSRSAICFRSTPVMFPTRPILWIALSVAIAWLRLTGPLKF